MNSSWTKLLPKGIDNEKFREVLEHLEGTQVPELAVKYGPLREAIVVRKLHYLLNYPAYGAPAEDLAVAFGQADNFGTNSVDGSMQPWLHDGFNGQSWFAAP